MCLVKLGISKSAVSPVVFVSIKSALRLIRKLLKTIDLFLGFYKNIIKN